MALRYRTPQEGSVLFEYSAPPCSSAYALSLSEEFLQDIHLRAQ
jgi:hypothetical protein